MKYLVNITACYLPERYFCDFCHVDTEDLPADLYIVVSATFTTFADAELGYCLPHFEFELLYFSFYTA